MKRYDEWDGNHHFCHLDKYQLRKIVAFSGCILSMGWIIS